jgi:hypothetical protein
MEGRVESEADVAASPARPVAARVQGTGRKVLFSAMKNEAPFLLEWVAYHKAIGFDDIVICSNPSNDGTEELLAALAAVGEITHLQATVPTGASPQYMATQAFEREVGFRDGDWYLWLDADEFLNVHVGDRSVGALIDAMGDKQIALINWRIFGSSGHKAFPGRFISEDFTGAAAKDLSLNYQLKAIFRFSRAVRGFAQHGIHRPKIARNSGLLPEQVLAGSGRTISTEFKVQRRWLNGDDIVRSSRVEASEFGWALAQINHYIVRTGDYFALKSVRGRGYMPRQKVTTNNRHTPEFFRTFDRNEAEDRSILHWQDAVTALIARFMSQQNIANAVYAAEQKTKVELAAALARLSEPAAPRKVVTPANPLPVRRKLAEGETPRRVLFCAMKNEAPFLLEWIAYHKAIGFDDIVICSNPSNDGTEELLTALAAAGEIKHLRAVVKNSSPQYTATKTFERDVGFRDGDWYLWLDADEFLNVHVGDRSVGALIDAMGEKQVALINWRIFGTSGHKGFPGRFIASDFVGAADSSFLGNRSIKTLFRCSPSIRGFARLSSHRPRLTRTKHLQIDDVLAGNGRSATPGNNIHTRWLNGEDLVRVSRVGAEDFGWEVAQINHYILRTKDFFHLKNLRGRSFVSRQKLKTNTRHTPEFFAQHDRNEAEDRTILHWQDQVSAEMARLLANSGIADAKAEADALTERALAAVNSSEHGDDMTDLSAGDDASGSEIPAPPERDVDRAEVPSILDLAQSFGEATRQLLIEQYAAASTILEYGSGSSTVHAALANRKVISVESDKVWAGLMIEYLTELGSKAIIHHVNIGATGLWGMPKKRRHSNLFSNYPLSVWDRDDLGVPDLVLIDGRFRKACLVAVMLRATRPTTVLFDDYAHRRFYHDVEKLAAKEEVVGRMARFTVTPGPIPPEMLTQVISWFSDPR